MLLLPSTALAQATPTAAPTAQPTAVAPAALTLSSSKDAVGTSITANGTGFRANETVDVTFNGTAVGSPGCSGQRHVQLELHRPAGFPGHLWHSGHRPRQRLERLYKLRGGRGCRCDHPFSSTGRDRDGDQYHRHRVYAR